MYINLSVSQHIYCTIDIFINPENVIIVKNANNTNLFKPGTF